MQFSVSPGKIKGCISEIDSLEHDFRNMGIALDDIVNTNAIQMDSYIWVRKAIKGCRQNVDSILENTRQMGSGIKNAMEEYEAHEQNIIENAGRGGAIHSGKIADIPTIPGLPLPWSAMFPAFSWLAPLISPSCGGIGISILNTIMDIFINGYDDSSSSKISKSYQGGKTGLHYDIDGNDVGYDAEYHLAHFTVSSEESSSWDIEKGNAKAGISGKIGFSAVDGKISENIGNGKVSLEGSLGNLAAEGAIGLSLFSDGKFTPSVYGEVSAKANVASGKIYEQYGTDDFNAHAKADGTLLGAEAEAKFQAGRIVDDDGSVKYGVKGKVGAEAYLAEGSIGGGFTLFGIKFDVSVKGKAGGAGAKAGGEVTTGAAEGELGVGLGVGVGIKLKVDWTGFKWPW